MEPHSIRFYVVATARSPLESDGSPLLVITAAGAETSLEVLPFLLRGWDQRPDIISPEELNVFKSFFAELQEQRSAANQGTAAFLERIDDLQIGTLRSYASGACDESTLDEILAAALSKALPAVVWPESFDYVPRLPDGDVVHSFGVEFESIEAQAIEGYRSAKLSPYQARTMLGLARLEFDGFLKKRRIFDHAYGVEDLKEDLKSLNDHSS